MSRARLLLWLLAALALLALAAGGLLDARGAARSWRLGFVFASLAPPGAIAMLMLGRLTRAPWADAFQPQLRALAAAAPWLWLLGLPVALFIGWIFPWARRGGAPAHLRLWLSAPAFLARAAAALAGWTLLAALIARRPQVSDLVAALALVFQAIAVCVIPVDWLLSDQPGWIATDIGMIFILLEVLVSVAAVLLFTPALPKKSADDLAGFLIGSTLGLMYLTFVAWLIDWYGDLPAKVGWWLERVGGVRWIWIVVALALGLVAFAALAFGRRYRLAAGAAMLGVALWCVWLLGPTLGPGAWLSAPAALVFQAAVIGLLAAGAFTRKEALAHG